VDWYTEHCDGEWEHGQGVDIATLDNPGWRVKINLRGTASEEAVLENVDIDKGEGDWLKCFKEGGKFNGAGDPSKLPVILEHFLRFVGKL
jgi:Immunity protein 53